MAKLGYTTKFDELDSETAQIFIQISTEFNKLNEKEAKKKRKAKK